MRADDHLLAAREHREAADQDGLWPDSRATRDDPGAGRWSRTWDSAREHRRLAAAHVSQAAQLQAEYEEACGARPIEEVSISPLQRFGIGGGPTRTGVLVTLSPRAGAADRLLSDLRCHRAWMMLGRANMDDCPLDLPGIRVDAHGDTSGITLEISVEDTRLIPELQRRAALDLERARLRAEHDHE